MARQKAAELGEPTAGVAREILNPLEFVKSLTESTRGLAEEMVGAVGEGRDALEAQEMEEIEALEADIKDSLEHVVAHTGRADAIVERMLMLGTAQGAFEYLRLNDLVGEHARLACRAAERASEGFEVRLEELYDDAVGAVPLVAQGIARVVLNVVGNACYAVDERLAGQTEGYEPTIRITIRKEADRIKIEVRDNGPGIDEVILDKVMTSFFTTKPPSVGAGLGLSQCADAVRQHGGTIEIESRAGAGTTVRIELPAGGIEEDAGEPQRGSKARERARPAV